MRNLPAAAALLALGGIAAPGARAADISNPELERTFAQTVRPFVTTYCIACHSGSTPAGGFDLRQYSTVAAVVHDYPRWDRVLQKLSAGDMPPKAMKQPPEADRQRVIDFVQSVRAAEARQNAGDPGPVLARRLSNEEYNYTIRDLTGVDMQPTRQFPVDPANTAGFDNSGESLTMSPALLNKYLQAARDVADHMVLTPDGFDFAPHPMLVETDRDRYCIQRIVDFYKRQPTDYADYFAAAWRYKHRKALGEPAASLETVAAEAKVSPKYLAMIWPLLEESPEAAKAEVGPIARLQWMWRALPAPSGSQEPPALRAKCVEMRDFVVRIRKDTAMQFAAPVVRGLPAASQPLLNWKLRQFNTHRRDSDPQALRNDTDPPPAVPPIPKYAGLHREAAVRWAVVMQKSRAADPDLVVPAGERSRYEASFARFASVFPDEFYISERGRFFPDDSEDKGRLLSAGYHNVMGYWRDDQPLMELILDQKQQKELDKLWLQFDFIASYTERTWDQYYFNESGEVQGKGAESGTLRPGDKAVSSPQVIFGLGDAYVAKAQASDNPVAAEACRYHFQWVNDTLRSLEGLHAGAEPRQVDALLRFAARAYRRPLSQAEHDSILAFYHSLREKSELSHEDAIRDSIVSVLMSPKFCYRIDLGGAAAATAKVEPLGGYDLASRLSYFLWASMPDQELLAHAASGDLQKPDVLAAEARRMLKDERARGLAVEFGGHWLDFRLFEQNNAVDRQRFPSFTDDLREAMFQEPVRFLEDLIHNDRSILNLVYGSYTFVNPVLARHYGMPPVAGGADHWVRVEDADQYGRGGILPMAVFQTMNAPGLRTSPVKRGHWVVKNVLGEVVPPPPAVVPELPQDEAKMDLPLRDMLARHRQVQMCAACHSHFDSLGLAFEGYGPIGEHRAKDLGGRPIDDSADFPGGFQGAGLAGVEAYIRARRQNDFINNFCRELFAYALNRSLMLSDDPAIEDMARTLPANGYRFSPLVEAIVTSPQFRNRRVADSSGLRSER